MSDNADSSPLRGRPSVHPVRMVYHESPEVAARLKALAGEQGLTLAEVLRRGARQVLEAA